jgi:predicted house-cleaning NTP pyrophosphatase (Maf/HAM1 superfamily)
MIAEEKRAIVEKEAEAIKVAAEMDVKAKEMAALAQKTAKGDAVVEAVAAEKVAVAAKAKAVAVPVVAADSPSETPSGGRVLPKEEVSAETMAFLKTLKK